MTKVLAELCTGTSCHLMGAQDLALVLEELNEKLAEKIEIVYHTCLGQCGRGPNVIINGRFWAGITPPELKREILREIEKTKEKEE